MISKISKILVLTGIVVLIVSCGKPAEDDKNQSQGVLPQIKNSHILIFKNVSKVTVDTVYDYYEKNNVNKTYYANQDKSCDELGFIDLEQTQSLAKNTLSRVYVDKDGIYGCFEITSTNDKYEGDIKSILTTDFI